MDRSDVAVSKFLSYVLRHDPGSIGLALDRQGWADVEGLLERASAAGRRLSRADLERVVATNDKRRFTLSPDGTRIRAAQGHSIAVDLDLPAREPPPILYHGTADRFLPSILREGLVPRSRRQVHLSPDVVTARRVGARHGRSIVLRMDASAMYDRGHTFHEAENGVWLTDGVPPEFLAVEERG